MPFTGLLTEFEEIGATASIMRMPMTAAGHRRHSGRQSQTAVSVLYLGASDVVRLVQCALEMDAKWLFLNPSQFPTQLLGRLGRGIAPEIDRLIEAATRVTSGPWFLPVQSVQHPHGEF
jgi:hypothetical protein